MRTPKMKQILIILGFLITNQFCFSQTGTIKGHIQDSTKNEGLAFAHVFLVDKKIGTITDLKGYFIIDSIPVGTYDIKITYIGYQDTILTSVKVSKDTIVVLKINYPPPCKFNRPNKTCPICKKTDKVIPIILRIAKQRTYKKS